MTSDHLLVRGTIKGKEAGMADYNYLASEDAAFCRAFRLSEDQFLEMAGGLKKYVQFQLDRQQGRRAGFDIPSLPTNIVAEVQKFKDFDLDEKAWAKHLIAELSEKVQGVVATIRMNKRFSDLAQREQEEAKAAKERELKQLAETAASRYGWKPDSQSAKDWAEAEYEKQKRRY